MVSWVDLLGLKVQGLTTGLEEQVPLLCQGQAGTGGDRGREAWGSRYEVIGSRGQAQTAAGRELGLEAPREPTSIRGLSCLLLRSLHEGVNGI